MVFLLLLAAIPAHAIFILQTLAFDIFNPSSSPVPLWFEIGFLIMNSACAGLWWKAPERASPIIVRVIASCVAFRWTFSWFLSGPEELWISIASTMLYMPPLLLLGNLSGFSCKETVLFLLGMCCVSSLGTVMSEDITPFNDIRLSAALAVGWGLLAGYFQLWNDQRGELQNSLVLQRRLLEQALQDALTGLPNRRAGAQFLNDSIQRHAGVGVALIDIDHFKQINDRYGHDFGDDVLIAIGQQLKESTASDSRVSRWGGEEFLAVLPGYSHTATLEWSEQLRQSIEALMPYGLKVTISVGVARTEVINDQTVLRRADQALYRAKKGGRNQVFPQSVS